MLHFDLNFDMFCFITEMNVGQNPLRTKPPRTKPPWTKPPHVFAWIGQNPPIQIKGINIIHHTSVKNIL